MTAKRAAIAKRLMMSGFYQHEVAAKLGVNQGRISEINTGKIFADIPPAQPDELPKDMF
jgi:hypothetical protein